MNWENMHNEGGRSKSDMSESTVCHLVPLLCLRRAMPQPWAVIRTCQVWSSSPDVAQCLLNIVLLVLIFHFSVFSAVTRGNHGDIEGMEVRVGVRGMGVGEIIAIHTKGEQSIGLGVERHMGVGEWLLSKWQRGEGGVAGGGWS